MARNEERSGFGTQKVKDAECFSRREAKTVEPEGFTRFNHDFARGLIVSAGLARGTWHTRDMLTATGDDDRHAILGDAEPDRRLGEPRASIDVRVAPEAEHWVAFASRLGAEKVSGLIREGKHLNAPVLDRDF